MKMVMVDSNDSYSMSIVGHIVDVRLKNIKFMGISFMCDTITDADGRVFVRIPTVLTKEETAKVAESLIKDTIINILNDLIKEAEANPDWKAVNALRCAKKEISNLK